MPQYELKGLGFEIVVARSLSTRPSTLLALSTFGHVPPVEKSKVQHFYRRLLYAAADYDDRDERI